MKKVGIMLLIAFVIGVLIQLYIGTYRTADSANMVAGIVGGAVGFMIAVLLLPVIISLVRKFTNGKFPVEGFVTFSYIMLVILGLIMFIGQTQLKGGM